MLRVASIGLGWWSDELAKSIQGCSDVIRVTSCTSRSADKRAAFAETFGTLQHENYDAVLADPEVDAVLLSTPHSLHGEQVRQAAGAGKHVFVEKPITLTAEDGRAAAQACSDANVVLAVGHNRRFCAVSSALHGMIERGEFGTLLHFEANFSAPGALRYTAEHWRANRVESPGGAIAGLGIHLIDLMCALAGRVVRVTGQVERRAVPFEMDDTTSALLAFASGATGYLGTHFACPYTSSLNIYGTDANAFAKVDGNALHVQHPGGQPEPRPIEPVDSVKAELEDFARACLTGTPYRVRPEDAIHNVEIMQAIVASAAQGSAPITLGAERLADQS